MESRSTRSGVMLTTAALPLLLLASCGGDSGTDPEPCPTDVTAVDVTVTTGSSVRFDWSPACPVVLLLVEEGASDRWSLEDPGLDENAIEPPVTYGSVPAGLEGGQAIELTAGVTYEVVLWRLHPTTGNETLIAVHEFVR